MPDTVTLKEHFEAILSEKDKAINIALSAAKESVIKAENAAEKRFELLNELRSGVATKDQLYALEKIVDDLKTSRDQGKGKTAGLSQGAAIFLAVIGVLGTIIGIAGGIIALIVFFSHK